MPGVTSCLSAWQKSEDLDVLRITVGVEEVVVVLVRVQGPAVLGALDAVVGLVGSGFLGAFDLLDFSRAVH